MKTTRWVRPGLTHAGPDRPVSGPDRSPRGLFLQSDPRGGRRGARKASIGFDRDELARVVVKAYDIADQQLERGMAAARAVRSAGKHEGAGASAGLMGRTEQLGQRTWMLALEWLNVLGSAPTADGVREALLARLPAADAPWAEWLARAALLTRGASRPAEPVARDRAASPAAPAAPSAPREERFEFRLRHEERPPVPVLSWHGIGIAPQGPVELHFQSRAEPKTVIVGHFGPHASGAHELSIKLPAELAAGPWFAAMCDADGTQTGHIVLSL